MNLFIFFFFYFWEFETQKKKEPADQTIPSLAPPPQSPCRLSQVESCPVELLSATTNPAGRPNPGVSVCLKSLTFLPKGLAINPTWRRWTNQ